MSWFCENCNAAVPDRHVTYTEEHDPLYGGCGCDVTSLEPPVKPRQPDEKDVEIARLREELEAASRRAERAEGPLQDILDDHAIFCSELKDELHQAIQRAELAERREREALAMLLAYCEHTSLAFTSSGPLQPFSGTQLTQLRALLSRAREQENNSAVGGE